MRLSRRVFVLLLLAAWLPAVMHCDLEAAGFAFATECCEKAEAAGVDHCSPGRCDVAESDFTAPANDSGVVSVPVLCACLVPTVVLPEPTALIATAGSGATDWSVAPPELAHRWAFVCRAVAAPRAPALTS